MARTVSLLLSAQHSADLQGVIEDRGRPVKHVQRAQIILLSGERLPVTVCSRPPYAASPAPSRFMTLRVSMCEQSFFVRKIDYPRRLI